jgi:hypothetical protein
MPKYDSADAESTDIAAEEVPEDQSLTESGGDPTSDKSTAGESTSTT